MDAGGPTRRLDVGATPSEGSYRGRKHGHSSRARTLGLFARALARIPSPCRQALTCVCFVFGRMRGFRARVVIARCRHEPSVSKLSSPGAVPSTRSEDRSGTPPKAPAIASGRLRPVRGRAPTVALAGGRDLCLARSQHARRGRAPCLALRGRRSASGASQAPSCHLFRSPRPIGGHRVVREKRFSGSRAVLAAAGRRHRRHRRCRRRHIRDRQSRAGPVGPLLQIADEGTALAARPERRGRGRTATPPARARAARGRASPRAPGDPLSDHGRDQRVDGSTFVHRA